MEKTSKNGLDLIRISAGKLKGVWGKAFLAALIYVAPLIALCAIPYAGWALSIALFGYLTLGFINYMQKLLKGENPKLSVLFVQPEFAQAIFLGIIMAVGVIVGTILFIIPGILMIGYYSLSLFVLNEERIVNVTDTLNVAARKMNGNKTGLFAYKVIFYLFYALVGAATLVGLLFIAKLYETQMALAIVLGVVLVLVAIVLISIITIYFYAANVVFYDEIVRPVEVKGYELASEKEANVAEVKVEEVKAENAQEPAPAPAEENADVKVEDVKPAPKKATATKTAAKKSTTKKTTTAKKAPSKTTKTTTKKD